MSVRRPEKCGHRVLLLVTVRTCYVISRASEVELIKVIYVEDLPISFVYIRIFCDQAGVATATLTVGPNSAKALLPASNIWTCICIHPRPC